MKEIILFIYLVLYIMIDERINYYHIIKNNKWHTYQAILRTMTLYIISSAILSNIAKGVACGTVSLFIYWVFFDIRINKRLGYYWYSTGTTSMIDIFLNKIKSKVSLYLFKKKIPVVAKYFYRYTPFIIKIISLCILIGSLIYVYIKFNLEIFNI